MSDANEATYSTMERASRLMGQRLAGGALCEDDIEWLHEWAKMRMRAYDEGAELLRGPEDIGPMWDAPSMVEWLCYDLGGSEMDVAELVDEVGLIAPTLPAADWRQS